MPRQTRHRILYRIDIRQKTDRPTNSIILQYIGRRRLDWHDSLYGYDEGTFFVCNLDEIGYPPSLVELADDLGIDIGRLPDARTLRIAAAEALAAEGMVDAPELIGDLASPLFRRIASDQRELERKHMIAVARLTELTRIMSVDMRRRCLPACDPVEGVEYVGAPMPLAGVEYARTEPAPPLLAPAPPPTPEPEPVVEEAVEDVQATLNAASTIVRRARHSVVSAREAELPQRLPGGARRRLKQMPPAAYLAYGEALDVRSELCAAMADGRAMGRKDREVVVIDWDGEWPVVVRRYGQGGRTIYKVEDALRRHGIEVKSDAA
jgi:hypothetical protein